jgi:hypothetical protein
MECPIFEKDSCLICLQHLNIPVLPAQTCTCEQIVCMYCFASYFKINEKNPNREIYTCLLRCGKTYKNLSGDDSYTRLPRSELSRLDKLYGNIKCQYCDEWEGTRIDFLKHEEKCEKIAWVCNLCKEKTTKNKHIIECIGCKDKFNSCELKNHQRFKCIGTRCEHCEILIDLHKTSACKYCRKMVPICPSFGIEKHYSKCVARIDLRGEIFDIHDITKVCHRCGLVYLNDSHNSHCATFIDMMKKLGKETPYANSLNN